MKIKYPIIMLAILSLATSCTLVPAKLEKKYPLPPYENKQFILSIHLNDDIKKFPISYTPKKISIITEVYYPESWVLPNKKTLIAVPKFNDPTKLGLVLDVYLKHNKTDGTLNLIGKYNHRFFDGWSQQNLYISEPKLKKIYGDITNQHIVEQSSPFYLIKFILNKQYKIFLSASPNSKHVIYISISEENKK